MQTNTGRTPSEWIAIHEGEIERLEADCQLGAYSRATAAAIIEHVAAVRYWEAVRNRVIGGGREPLPWEARRRAEWRRVAAVAEEAGAAEAYGDHMAAADIAGWEGSR